MNETVTIIGTYTIRGEWGAYDIKIAYWSNGNDGGYYYPLTPCCDATAKGMDGYTGCRSCYEEIDPFLGMAWADEKEFNAEVNRGFLTKVS